MTTPTFTVALAHYDRHVPLFEGKTSMTGGQLHAFPVGMSIEHGGQSRRHERMIRDREWDAAEVSLSSYLVAKDQGSDLVAIPVFPGGCSRRGCCSSVATPTSSTPRTWRKRGSVCGPTRRRCLC